MTEEVNGLANEKKEITLNEKELNIITHVTSTHNFLYYATGQANNCNQQYQYSACNGANDR
jgi:hypothetical protein